MGKKKPKGPRGGVRHQPGRGHDRKSAPGHKARFRAKQRRRRAAHDEELRKRWEEWDKLTKGQKQFLPDLKPTEPRPPDAG
jgi:hypothetical protein